ncbi:hypothetical protein R1flu_028232 [Riccia fluitans]|uniref:Uncharacterized protein n=1 Tax=Riccia fluitans TaxID=41844 RepID=A0ABD1XLK0_9MARC
MSLKDYGAPVTCVQLLSSLQSAGFKRLPQSTKRRFGKKLCTVQGKRSSLGRPIEKVKGSAVERWTNVMWTLTCMGCRVACLSSEGQQDDYS